jgi:hypothetical protein
VRAAPAYLLAAALCLLVGVTTHQPAPTFHEGAPAAPAPQLTPTRTVAPTPPTPPAAAPAPAGLPVFTYRHAPSGFPADLASSSTTAVTEALHPARKLAVYDAPGGRPRAFLPKEISGVEVTVPIVERRPGWVAVLLPSVNRRIGWLPESSKTEPWTVRTVHDQLVLRRSAHELTWLRDGVRQGGWTVATGAKATPTPLGRTFVLGRTTPHGSIYAGLDALVLGAVPDDKAAVAPGLQDGHTALHGWYRSSVFGHSISNGCIRVPSAGLKTLLDRIPSGATVVVLD